MCPKCQNFSARDENSNVMRCSFCKMKWCWICRQTFKGSKSIAQHFEFYNVFGCPGLARSPSYFFVTLLLNLLYALLFPLTLLFAPMIVMIKNYQGKRLVEDQADRLQQKTTRFLHKTLAQTIVLIGYSLLGLTCGVFCSVVGSLIGAIYQVLKVFTIFFKVAFGCESRIDRSSLPPTSPGPMSLIDVTPDTSITISDQNRSAIELT